MDQDQSMERDRAWVEALVVEESRSGREAFRTFVQRKLERWGEAQFVALCASCSEAEAESDRLSREEERRGLPGPGPWPEPIEDVLRLLHDEEDNPWPEGAGAWIPGPRPPAAGRSDLAELSDELLATRAQRAMERMEPLVRVQEIVFGVLANRLLETLADKAGSDDWIAARLGPALAARFIRGTTSPNRPSPEHGILTRALSSALIRRDLVQAEIALGPPPRPL